MKIAMKNTARAGWDNIIRHDNKGKSYCYESINALASFCLQYRWRKPGRGMALRHAGSSHISNDVKGRLHILKRTHFLPRLLQLRFSSPPSLAKRPCSYSGTPSRAVGGVMAQNDAFIGGSFVWSISCRQTVPGSHRCRRDCHASSVLLL